MPSDFKRVNILIRADQAKSVASSGLSLSGLVRDLLDDHFSTTSIQLSVSQQLHEVYQAVVSNFGASDSQLEKYLLKAFVDFLEDKREEIETLQKRIEDSIDNDS